MNPFSFFNHDSENPTGDLAEENLTSLLRLGGNQFNSALFIPYVDMPDLEIKGISVKFLIRSGLYLTVLCFPQLLAVVRYPKCH